MADNFTKKELIAILLIALILVVAMGFKFLPKEIFFSKSKIDDINNNQNIDDQVDNIDDTQKTEIQEEIIMIHISGQVFKSGLVKLKLGQRLIDAVELAGGLKEDADLDRINLAKKLKDEDKIYIPAIGEEGLIENISQGNEIYDGKVNINNCDKIQLLTLPGIGEVIASRILEYREKSPFSSIEDLLNISGIGDKKFEEIKDLVIIN